MRSRPRYRWIARLLIMTGLLAASSIAVPTAQAASSTVVSLTFDDGHWSHYANAAPILKAHGMRGTFYLNSGQIRTRQECQIQWCWNLAWEDATEMARDGQEIGGHTLEHVDLTSVSLAEAQHQACDDRTNLLNHGFSPVTSFAYPYGTFNTTVKQVVEGCGYTSGRSAGGFPTGVYAESIPPLDRYATRVAQPADQQLAGLQRVVTQAENNGGGWVQMVFHEVCDCPDAPLATTPATLSAFLDWLQPRSANGTQVQTVGQVMGATPPGPDTTPPSTTAYCNGAACSSWYRNSVSVTLAASDAGGSGVDKTFYTTDGSDPTSSSSRITYANPFTVTQTTTVRFSSTDKAGNVEPARSQAVRLDTVAPTVSLTSPATGASIPRGTVVTVAANATDTGSGVAQVTFAANGTTLGTDTTAPYQISWNTRKTSFGQQTLTAVATDVAGTSTTSAGVTVTIIK
jgi:peptidoglycan/xylan/chitin deacetylase (PgdA/CDA1 family)